VLALNAGSSRMKLAVFEIKPDGMLGRVAAGRVEGIGTVPHFYAYGPNGKVVAEQKWARGAVAGHEDYLSVILDYAEHALGRDTLAVVGHRVAHGGGDHIRPEPVSEKSLAALEALVPLAPLLQPHSLAPIRALAKLRPKLIQIACFDTAFHHTLPEIATRFALPRALHDAGIRRYGFHGLSCEYIAETLREEAPKLAAARVIVAHLGNAASLCAMRGCRSVDISMGFSALDGLMMGTQCGTLDPGVVLYLLQQRGMSVQAVENLLHHKSGLLGVSGVSSEMRELCQSGDPRAGDAIALFELRIVREIGALCAVLTGLEGLVFTAGIGEHMPQLRKRICDRLRIPLDNALNEKGVGKISMRESGVEVWVIPTDEEAMIARHAALSWQGDAARKQMAQNIKDERKSTRWLFGKR
jgi:acetate kinase